MDTIYKVLDQKGRTTIPFEIRRKLGMKYNDILSFTMDNNRVIITKEKLCNDCNNNSDRDEKKPFSELIDSLSPMQQYELFNKLAERWASGRMG